MERELTLTAVYHPQFIDGWQLVDHPTLLPVQNGAPDLGWEGDPRLAVYLHGETKTFVLWRLENDWIYRPVARLQPGAPITPESVNSLIRNLVRIDSRRGFDAFTEVEQSQAAHDRVVETERQEATAALAEKLQFGLARSHLPGVDVSRLSRR